jgi:hypothetical protein
MKIGITLPQMGPESSPAGIKHVFYDLAAMPITEQLHLLEKLRRAADV